MKNTIVAYAIFSFKGEKLTPSTIIDLDQIMESNGSFEVIHSTLAMTNDIGLYSYEFEMLQAADISYKDAQGLAEKHLIDNKFDFETFHDNWHYDKAVQLLNDIAKKYLNIDNIENHDDIKNALLDAYNQGRNKAD
jgi:hypothetical protein